MKQPVSGDLGRRAVLRAADAHAGHAAFVAEHLVERRPEVQLHLSVGDLGHHPVDQDRLGAELVAPMDDVHLGSDVREIERLLDRGVAAADHAHLLAAIEEAVAGRAAAHAAAHEGLLRGRPRYLAEAPVAMTSASQVYCAESPFSRNGRLAQLDLVDVIEDDLGVEALGVLEEALHEVGAHDAVDVGGPVVDVGGRHQLAALRDAGDQHRLQVGARRVDRGRVAGRPGAEDENAGVVGRQGHGGDREVGVWQRRRKSDMGLKPAGINAS